MDDDDNAKQTDKKIVKAKNHNIFIQHEQKRRPHFIASLNFSLLITKAVLDTCFDVV